MRNVFTRIKQSISETARLASRKYRITWNLLSKTITTITSKFPGRPITLKNAWNNAITWGRTMLEQRLFGRTLHRLRSPFLSWSAGNQWLWSQLFVSRYLGFRNRKKWRPSFSLTTFYEQLRRGPGNWEFKKITNRMIPHCQKLSFVWESILCKTLITYVLKNASPQWRHVHLSVYLFSIDNFVAPWYTSSIIV